MKGRAHDPLRIDVAAAAAEGAVLEGHWPLGALSRLAEEGAEPCGDARVQWVAAFESRRVRVGAPEVWLRLQATTQVLRTCQRCLQPVEVALAVDRELRFVAGEDEAAALDAEVEYDVLALAPRTDLRALVEDELLLALPLVPRHERCPQPLAVPDGAAAPDDDAAAPAPAKPFAALAALKRDPKP